MTNYSVIYIYIYKNSHYTITVTFYRRHEPHLACVEWSCTYDRSKNTLSTHLVEETHDIHEHFSLLITIDVNSIHFIIVHFLITCSQVFLRLKWALIESEVMGYGQLPVGVLKAHTAVNMDRLAFCTWTNRSQKGLEMYSHVIKDCCSLCIRYPQCIYVRICDDSIFSGYFMYTINCL